MILTTPRLRLRLWREEDRDAFAALTADPEVMRDLGGPLDRAGGDARLDRYRACYDREGFCRWAVTDLSGAVLGYAGLMRQARSVRPAPMSISAGGWRGTPGAGATPPRLRRRRCATASAGSASPRSWPTPRRTIRGRRR